jgi:acetyltransferase-like isoleucine patch superfamily enzyme
MIGSTVTTGKGVHVGTNATIIENNEIDDFSTLGAGGVLTKSIPTREIWTGNPARFLRNVM